MSSGLIFYIFCSFLFVHLAKCAEITALAELNMRGVRGYVKFTQESEEPGSPVSAQYRIQFGQIPSGPSGRDELFLVLKEFPVILPAAPGSDSCSDEALGLQVSAKEFQLGPFRLNETIEGLAENLKISLRGSNSIRGRSLLLVTTRNRRACATIVIENPRLVRTAVAHIQGNIVGEIYFRQYPGNPTETAIYTTLYKLVPDGIPANVSYNWFLMTTGPMERIRVGEDAVCRNMRIIYDPDFRDEADCSMNAPQNCKIGNLQGKLGLLPVGTVDRPAKRAFFTDLTFPLITGSETRAVYIAIFSPMNKLVSIACGQVKPLLPKLASATIRQNGVHGVIKFRQDSHFDSTEIYFDLKGLRASATRVSISQFPFRDRLKKDENLCSPQFTGSRYDPVDIRSRGPRSFISTTSGNDSIVTTDQIAIGDLSRKYGNLTGMNYIQKEFVDSHLPLFGSMSILGRSIILYNANNTEWVCGNIWPDEEVIVAEVKFFYTVGGRMTFVQSAQDWRSQTFIFGNLFYTNGVPTNNTYHHLWRVHSSPVLRDAFSWDGRCVSAADTYNPLLVDTRKNYASECKASIPARCQLGDLSAKLSTLSVGLKASSGIGKFFYTDSFLPLSGPHSIVNKSIVIYEREGGDARLACGNVGVVHPVKAIVKEWIGRGKVEGTITAAQTRASIALPTTVNIGLQGLATASAELQVRTGPIEPNVAITCTATSLGELFDPFNITSGPVGPKADENSAVGDLSDRYGSLMGRTEFAFHGLDANLPLTGPNSVLGRSVAIGQPNEFRSFACADFNHEVESREKGSLARAVAEFKGPFLQGFIRFFQMQYADGSTSDMTIQVRLAHMVNDSVDYYRTPSSHKWNIHQLPVSMDAGIIWESFRCISAGIVDNYFNTANDFGSDYRAECWIGNPERCAYGDVMTRIGPLKIAPDSRQVLTDPLLQMKGNVSVIGRSIVISDVHEEDGKEFRLACANIVEEETAVTTLQLLRTGQFNSVGFEEQVARAANLSAWNVRVKTDSIKTLYKGSCTQVEVQFQAPKAEEIMRIFSNYMDLDQMKYLGYDRCDKRKHNMLKKIKADIVGNIIIDDSEDDDSLDNFGVSINSSLFLILFTFVLVNWF